MDKQPTAARIALAIGTILYVLGILLMCYYPWAFALACVAFGVAAATAKGNLRWFAVVLIAVSAATSIRIARDEEKARLNALEAISKNDELNKQPATQNEPERQN
jgi:membrane protein implicated in regulation of membrane protease activity